MKACSVGECGAKVSARGYCGKHYYRWRLYGDPMTTARTPHGVRTLRDDQGRKQCSGCGEWLEVELFSKHPETADGLGAKCHPCIAASRRFRRYGVDEKWFALKVAQQSGRCAICRVTSIADPGTACVDHDHSCCSEGGACGNCTRGVLCRRCNLFIGHASDSISSLRNAIEYLEMYA